MNPLLVFGALSAGMAVWDATIGDRVRGVGVAACVALLPPAANVALMMAQMTMPMAMVLPCLLCLVGGGDALGGVAIGDVSGDVAEGGGVCAGDAVGLGAAVGGAAGTVAVAAVGDESILGVLAARLDVGWKAAACSVLAGLLLAGNFLMVSVDQHVMLAGREACVALIRRVAAGVDPSDDPLGGCVFVGRPSDSSPFHKDEPWDLANSYARYGEFWMGYDCNTSSYVGLLRDAGIDLHMNWDSAYWVDVAAMPAYPLAGSIAPLDGGATVVKLA